MHQINKFNLASEWNIMLGEEVIIPEKENKKQLTPHFEIYGTNDLTTNSDRN